MADMARRTDTRRSMEMAQLAGAGLELSPTEREAERASRWVGCLLGGD
jgi:hypothetical protein